jgi:hypothetical protein
VEVAGDAATDGVDNGIERVETVAAQLSDEGDDLITSVAPLL